MKKTNILTLLCLTLLVLAPIAGYLFTGKVSASTDATEAELTTQQICYNQPIPAGWAVTEMYAQSYICGVGANTYNFYNVYTIEKISDYFVGTVKVVCNLVNPDPIPDWVVIDRQAANYTCGVLQQPPPPGGAQVINLRTIRRINGPTPTPTPTPVPGRTPIGYLDSIDQTTRVARGWSLDPDNPQTSNMVHFYINGPAGNTQGSGTFLSAVTANIYRPDVNTSTGYPGNHGYEYTIPAQYCDGLSHTIYAYGIDTGPNANALLTGSPKTLQCSPPSTVRRTPFDFNGDGKADITVLRDSANWYSLLSPSNTFSAVSFGQSGDIPVAADYNGDGKTDVAVSRSENGSRYFYEYLSPNNQFYAVSWGLPVDVPVVADYDGDGKADVAVWRPGNGVGTWYIINSSTNQSTSFQFGFATDKPVIGDFDGDGKADIAVTRQVDGKLNWYIQRSALGFTALQFGLETDVTVPADYDGDGKTDVAVYRNGFWYLQRSRDGYTSVSFGQSGDTPAEADFDGDGKADITVFRPENGAGYFYWLNSSNNQFNAVSWGLATDVPIAGNFPR